MTVDPRWRAMARQVLYEYGPNRQLLRQLEQDALWGSSCDRQLRLRGGGPGDPTAAQVLRLTRPEYDLLRRQVQTVERLLALLQADGRRHRQRCLDLLYLVYFRRSHSLFYAAVALEISERTAKRMNSELLSFVACEMGWQDGPCLLNSEK